MGVFEKLGIDYCCGGNQSLEEACRAAKLPLDQVLGSLAAAEQSEQASKNEHDWQFEPLTELVAHIKDTHHKYTREEITRLGPLFEKVCLVHGKNHPELLDIRITFGGLANELIMHLSKEEVVLFPYTPPPDVCVSYQALYRALAEFEADLHQHIHLENNILFPRSIAMEHGL